MIFRSVFILLIVVIYLVDITISVASNGEFNITSSFFVDHTAATHMFSLSSSSTDVDVVYPGTAVQRLKSVRERVILLRSSHQLNGTWEEVRRSLLWAGGLRDLTSVAPGKGYTGHAFNDFNHCDLTTMLEHFADNENNGQLTVIHARNPLGEGIKIASLPDLGPGGSWTTCILGNNLNPPQDVAHVQFRSRIAFKLVWLVCYYCVLGLLSVLSFVLFLCDVH
jgi:hypothetical protein